MPTTYPTFLKRRAYGRLSALLHPALGKRLIARQAYADGVYIYRTVQNADELMAWAHAYGVANLLPSTELHVTIVHSSAPVTLTPVANYLDVPANAWVRCQHLGDKGAVVAVFKSSALTARWQEAREAGASWDYDAYFPHVTLSYNSPIVPDGVPSIPIILGPEVAEPLSSTWSDQFRTLHSIQTKAAVVPVQKYSEDQPREPAGTAEGGQFSSGGGGGSGDSDTIADSFSVDRGHEALGRLVPFTGMQSSTADFRFSPLRVLGKPVGKYGGYTDRRPAIEAGLIGQVAEVTTVRIDQLASYQRYVSGTKARALIDTEAQWTNPANISNADLPVVSVQNGKMWLLDGNHRVTALKLGGAKTVKVQLHK